MRQQLTVPVLMTPESRLDREDLEDCLEGVTIRNSIMQAGIKKSGSYWIRDHTEGDLQRGHKGIMALYRAFAAAIELLESPD